jgi:hypothetical protein
VGDFEVATSGGFWVAIRAIQEEQPKDCLQVPGYKEKGPQLIDSAALIEITKPIKFAIDSLTENHRKCIRYFFLGA